jgi:hypothetical protein
MVETTNVLCNQTSGSGMSVSARVRALSRLTLLSLVASLAAAGCAGPSQADANRRIAQLQQSLAAREHELAAQQATIAELNERLAEARAIGPEALQRIYYPEQLIIDRLTGGYDDDGRPGDEGVVVYLRPVDREGDTVKAAGEARIELYDLANPPDANQIGTYTFSPEQLAKLWHGKLLTQHFTLKCPWPAGRAPSHAEVTVRAVFVDYLTQRVISAQTACNIRRPP